MGYNNFTTDIQNPSLDLFISSATKQLKRFVFSTRAGKPAGYVPGGQHGEVRIWRWAVLTLVNAVVSDLVVSHY